MAKKLYEEENIRAIANKIRQFSWNKEATYTTKEMPGAIENACQNEYEDGFSSGWDLGWNEGFDEGVAQGGGELHHLLYEQIQSNHISFITYQKFGYLPSMYGNSIDYNMTFDDYVDTEHSSISSNPFTYSVDNYTDFYLYLYIRARDIGNSEEYDVEIVVPPNMNNSVEFVSKVSYGNPVEWSVSILYARFVKDEI